MAQCISSFYYNILNYIILNMCPCRCTCTYLQWSVLRSCRDLVGLIHGDTLLEMIPRELMFRRFWNKIGPKCSKIAIIYYETIPLKKIFSHVSRKILGVSRVRIVPSELWRASGVQPPGKFLKIQVHSGQFLGIWQHGCIKLFFGHWGQPN